MHACGFIIKAFRICFCAHAHTRLKHSDVLQTVDFLSEALTHLSYFHGIILSSTLGRIDYLCDESTFFIFFDLI